MDVLQPFRSSQCIAAAAAEMTNPSNLLQKGPDPKATLQIPVPNCKHSLSSQFSSYAHNQGMAANTPDFLIYHPEMQKFKIQHP